MKRRLLKVLAWSTLVVAVGAALLPLLARPSNCGGNSAALSTCRTIIVLKEWAGTNGGVFDWEQLEPVDQTNLLRAVANHWTPNAGYWRRTNDFSNAATKQIIVVCDRAYDNVPQPTIWNLYHRNPAHAVGYSDGTSGLITPAEFSQLDLGSFMSLTAVATNHSR